MTEEKELLTILSEDEYKRVLARLRKEFGEPKTQKRLSLQSDDYSQTDIDTRIRITNGNAELMQKVGDWKNITKGKSRTEISIPLPSDSNVIAGLYRIIRNLMKGPKIENIVMQFESFIWETKNIEIKLTHQFGKSDAYNCEFEVLDSSYKPKDLMKKYNVPINSPTQTEDFWRKWNEKVNLNADQLADEELLEIIKKYLD
ncbi:hypothetical protein A2630_00710 [Candidatus Woesebacteria bacterium RIFCSPHIGHO2_01_FULL_44_10]|uniref:CYTH domain-containing protein n=1 Tax=Candidatus Woesebacteria bacterium RIFCSPLOWO2_01_FULL_44_14 TaxID=1802525 RepID=A0A1F8C3N7_9BACT|nr:MAG: hypothetical protein A2630_00710 [Candidatus Woesebacteria bacterium RIFCSPHIGHO2_01_FULL_44_10]OGM54357.1 MAG: hypothetical protein A3F62_01220 [Candidatus Woesebacteria bacterium RIFCSPHIGHO2_12_FULL_44_11]OGM70258.1 MAG: hypothetical protein A2975_04265 [Candidatus Woesebacteria bacterium RIFCSPLOWO2_01_FULL_44_14]